MGIGMGIGIGVGTEAVKLNIRQAVIVEGKYDKIKLSSIMDGLIIQTNGFRIYKDKEKAAMIRAVAQKQGVILLTDSDTAGFRLRGRLKSILGGIDEGKVKNLYIPQITGKERRKSAPSKDGFLGVEGIAAGDLRELLKGASAAFETSKALALQESPPITKLDFYNDGLSGGENSANKRQLLLKKMGLPSYISANGLIEMVNSLLTKAEYEKIISELCETTQGSAY